MTRFQSPDLLILEFFKETEPTLYQIHQRFIEEYGTNIKQMQPRFAQRHDPIKTVDPERFENLLGIDVAHDTHPISQWFIGRQIIRNRRFARHLTQIEMNILLMTEVTHDYGEAPLKKDVPFGDKSEQDDIDEIASWDLAVSTITSGNLLAGLQNKVRPVLTGENKKLHDIFKSSEHIGYIQTGIRAGRLALHSAPTISVDEQAVLGSIISDVRTRFVVSAQDLRVDHPQIDRLLTDNHDVWQPMQVV